MIMLALISDYQYDNMILIIAGPKSIEGKFSLIVLGVTNTMSVFLPPYWSKVRFYLFCIETLGLYHDYDSIRDICFIKAVVLLCEHGHFFLHFLRMVNLNPPPPTQKNTIRVNSKWIITRNTWCKGINFWAHFSFLTLLIISWTILLC